jgi:transcriptional regulator
MKTSFDKFMASSAVNEVALSEMKIELGILQDASKAQLDALNAKSKIAKSLDTLRNEVALAKKSAVNSITLYEKAKRDAKALGMDSSQIDVPLKMSNDLFNLMNTISQKLLGLGK